MTCKENRLHLLWLLARCSACAAGATVLRAHLGRRPEWLAELTLFLTVQRVRACAVTSATGCSRSPYCSALHAVGTAEQTSGCESGVDHSHVAV
jgi:hypothetical protein